jgi:putative membrane protein
MRFIQAIIVLAFLGALGVFAVGNTEPLTVHFLKYSTTAPVALLAVGIYLLGMLTGWTVVSFLRRSIRQATRHPNE